MALQPYKAVFRRHLLSMLARCPAPRSVLEAGCADGKFFSDFPGAEYSGTTFSESDLRTAQQQHPEARFYFVDLGEPESLPNEQFDIVVCTHTISYVPPHRMGVAVQNLVDAIAQDGHLLIQFTEDDAPLLRPMLAQRLVTLRHERYGGSSAPGRVACGSQSRFI